MYRGYNKRGEYIEQSLGLFPQVFIAMKVRDYLDGLIINYDSPSTYLLTKTSETFIL
jgi:hypothetical protein